MSSGLKFAVSDEIVTTLTIRLLSVHTNVTRAYTRIRT